jgi:hypothetical protein
VAGYQYCNSLLRFESAAADLADLHVQPHTSF